MILGILVYVIRDQHQVQRQDQRQRQRQDQRQVQRQDQVPVLFVKNVQN